MKLSLVDCVHTDEDCSLYGKVIRFILPSLQFSLVAYQLHHNA